MRLANQKVSPRLAAANDTDPREGMSAEVIDLASRNAFPLVTQRKGKSDGLGLAAGVAIVALLGGVTLWSMNSARVAPQQQATTAVQPVASPPAPVVAPADTAPALPPQAYTPPAGQADPAPQTVYAAPPQTAAAPAGNPHSSPTVVFDASALPAPMMVGEAAKPGAASAAGSNDEFASRVGGVGGGTATAAAMVDPKTTVTQGTLIPAILETAIDTNVPGYVRAVVSRDVRSFDGSRVLVPRSSRLIGEYKSGLQAGQKRAYVIWTRLIRPDGVSVALGSPAVDFSGQTGLPGQVNSRFFSRFGSAMLLSVIGGLTAAVSGGASLVLGGGQSAAAAAVGQDGQIGPVVRVRQGEPIRVFTARDLDFSKVTTQ